MLTGVFIYIYILPIKKIFHYNWEIHIDIRASAKKSQFCGSWVKWRYWGHKFNNDSRLWNLPYLMWFYLQNYSVCHAWQMWWWKLVINMCSNFLRGRYTSMCCSQLTNVKDNENCFVMMRTTHAVDCSPS